MIPCTIHCFVFFIIPHTMVYLSIVLIMQLVSILRGFRPVKRWNVSDFAQRIRPVLRVWSIQVVLYLMNSIRQKNIPRADASCPKDLSTYRCINVSLAQKQVRKGFGWSLCEMKVIFFFFCFCF